MVGPSVKFRQRRTVGAGLLAIVGILLLLAVALLPSPIATSKRSTEVADAVPTPTNLSPVSNFSASINRLVQLLGVAGSGLLALVWTRVAFSWFSHDVTKKVQAKERARDALIGTLLFVAALSGLVWGLAHWVLTGA